MLENDPAPKTYDFGNVLRITYTLRNKVTDELVDAGAVRFDVNRGNGAALTTYILGDAGSEALQRDSLGTYYIDLELDASGFWPWRFSTSNPLSGQDGSFFVEPINVLDPPV